MEDCFKRVHYFRQPSRMGTKKRNVDSPKQIANFSKKRNIDISEPSTSQGIIEMKKPRKDFQDMVEEFQSVSKVKA